MKSIRFRFLIAALAVLLGTAISRAQSADAQDAPPAPPMHHGYGMGEGHMMRFFAKKLNLTDEQKTQMHSIMQKEHPAMKPLRQQEHQIDLQLRQYVQGTYDEAKVRALAAQKAQVQVELTVAETRVHNELYQILTPDQQTQVKQMLAQHEARMQARMQEHQAPASPEQ